MFARPDSLRAALRVTAAVAALAATSAYTDNPQATVPAGSTINTQLTSADVDTKRAKDGDLITLQVLPPYPSGEQTLQGASIHAHVASVRPAGQGRPALLTLAFDSITFADGRNEPISGSVLKMGAKKENTVARKGLGSAVGAAVGSQTIGRLLGGTLGSVVGIAGGAAAGYAYGSNDKPNFDLSTGSQVQIQTSQPLEVPRHQAGQ